MAITVNHLSKYYGKQKALDDVSFTLNQGEICGFLGPNGAGKSTTMKIITGYLDDFTGQVDICGYDNRRNPLKTKSLMGYLPEHNPLYPDMYIKEYLYHVARLYHLSDIRQKVENILEMTGLLPEKKKKIGQLSKGYRQRVGLAQALVHDPEVLILDEPMTGLDPNQLEEIRNLIIQIGKNKTVLLSTHIMQEVEAICDRIIIIHQGKIVTDQPKSEIHRFTNSGLSIFVKFAEDFPVSWLQDLQTEIEKTVKIAPATWQILARKDCDPRISLFQAAAAHRCPIIELRTEEKQLEDIFRQLTTYQNEPYGQK